MNRFQGALIFLMRSLLFRQKTAECRLPPETSLERLCRKRAGPRENSKARPGGMNVSYR
jgi:hypothetical protein